MTKLRLQELIRSILHPNSLRGRLARGTFWITVAALVTQITAMAAAVLTARILGDVRFGEVGIVRSTVLLLSVFAGSSLGMSCTKYVAEFRNTAPERAGRIIGLMLNVGVICGTIGTLLCLLLAPSLAEQVMKAGHLTNTLRIGCVLVGLSILIGAEIGALNGLEAFHTTMVIKALLGALIFILVPVGGWKFGVDGVIGGYVIASLCTLPVLHIALKRRCKEVGIIIIHRKVSTEMSVLWKFSTPVILAGISTQSFEWLARVLLARQPDGFAQVGFLTAAMSLAVMVQFVPQQIAIPLMPILSNIYNGQKRPPSRSVLLKISVLPLSAGLLVGVAMAVFAKPLLLMYGSSFSASYLVLVILALTYALATTTNILSAVLISCGRVWTQTIHKILWGCALFVSLIFLVNYGALGVAIAYAIANLVYIAVQVWAVLLLSANTSEIRS